MSHPPLDAPERKPYKEPFQLRFRYVVTLLVVLVAALAATVGAANWIVTCGQSHTNNDDPIVFPGMTGASHTHLFTGARTTNAGSTFESLAASSTTCGMPADKSGYWIPKPLNYNLHPNGGMLLYYNGSPNARAFPDGLKIVVGKSTATSEADNPAIASGRIRFKCGPGSNTETPRPPVACSSGMAVAVIEFPQWWDGVRLDSPDHFSHMSYRRDAAHPIELMRVKAYVRIAVPAGQPINLTLSSGPYYTMHMDFMDGWVKGGANGLQHFIDTYVKTGRNAGTNPQS